MKELRGHRRGRAAMLLSKLIAGGWYDVQRLAEVMVVSERTVALYMTGEIEIPFERQACLALFLIESVPPLARQGRSLLAQAQSAQRFAESSTVTHTTSPMPNARSY